MSRQTDLKHEWDDRARRLGATKRAVLFKRLPGFVNNSIHRRHLAFVMRHISPSARRLLDAGSGYGRLSGEIKAVRPNLHFQGVELSTEFAEVYQREVGPCYNGPIREYQADEPLDVILAVTLLMYLDPAEQLETVKRLWSFLRPGGVVICIEPAVEIMRLWRRMTRKVSASPTGGSVNVFAFSDLWSLFSDLTGAQLSGRMSIRLIPGIEATTVHHGLAVKKEARPV